VPKGVLRSITGKIVDQNPEGFKITTPEASVGIRGTIVSLRTGSGVSTVYVENTLRRVYVNGTNVPSGFKITLPSDPMRIEPILPKDRRDLGRDFALLGGSGVAAAAPEPESVGKNPHEPLFISGLVPPETPLTDIPMGTQNQGNTLQSTPMGHVSGLLASTRFGAFYLGWGNSGSGSFNFDVNLSNGKISNGQFSLSTVIDPPGAITFMLDSTPVLVLPAGGSTLSVNLSNGSGTAGPGLWRMDTFGSGSMSINATTLSSLNPGQVVIKGPDTLLSIPAGPILGGVDYSVFDSLVNPIDFGSGSGTISK
jgi:hypothetical protein